MAAAAWLVGKTGRLLSSLRGQEGCRAAHRAASQTGYSRMPLALAGVIDATFVMHADCTDTRALNPSPQLSPLHGTMQIDRDLAALSVETAHSTKPLDFSGAGPAMAVSALIPNTARPAGASPRPAGQQFECRPRCSSRVQLRRSVRLPPAAAVAAAATTPTAGYDDLLRWW